MMKVLVTGASGFLGSRIALLLGENGHQVRAAFRPGDDTRLLRGLPVEPQACDLLDEICTRRAMAGMDAVVHTAAMVTFQRRLYDTQMRVNVEGTRILLRAARSAGIRRFIHTSTVNTLGIPSEGSVGDEDTPFNWQIWRLGYMDSKKASEDLVRQAEGLETICVLPGTMFGPWDINVNAGQYILQCARGLGLAAPPGGTSVVHVDDVARGHLLALERGIVGERYVLGGENLTYHELFCIIAHELGRRPPLFTLPAPLLLGLGRAADRLSAHLPWPLPAGEGLLKAACSNLFYDSTKARQQLGYTFRPAAEAIQDAVSWYRDQGMI